MDEDDDEMDEEDDDAYNDDIEVIEPDDHLPRRPQPLSMLFAIKTLN